MRLSNIPFDPGKAFYGRFIKVTRISLVKEVLTNLQSLVARVWDTGW